MNYNANIGNILTNARKKKGITQNELAKKLFVTRQAISNWENGRAFPDVSVIFKLCKILDIDIRTIIDMDKNIKIEQVIEVEKKKTNRRNLIFIAIIIFIFVAIIATLVIVFNRNQFVVYNVTLDSNEFELNNSLIVKSKVKNYFQFGTLISKLDNTDVNTNYKIKLYKKQADEERLIFERNYQDNMFIIEDYGYGEYFDDIDADLSNLYLEISFIKDNKPYIYDYKLQVEETFKSNALVYLKNKAGGTTVANSETEVDVNALFTSGYSYNESASNFVKTLDNKEITIYPKMHFLTYREVTSDKTILIQYFVSQKRLNISAYSTSGDLLESNNYPDDSYDKTYEQAVNLLKSEYSLIGGK